MSRWHTVAVTDAPWILRDIEPAPATWFGGAGLSSLQLREVAQVRHDYVTLRDGIPLVRPRDVDETAGVIRPGATTDQTQGFALDLNLEVGDVLVSRVGVSLPILITPETRGVAFSSAFLVLRAKTVGAALWAILASSSGRSALRTHGSRIGRHTAASLLEMRLPQPSPAFAMVATQFAPTLSPTSFGDVSTSSWLSAWLADDWRIGRYRSETPRSVRLGDVARVSRGDVRSSACVGAPDVGLLPVIDGRSLRSPTPYYSRFAAAERFLVTDEHTVALSMAPPYIARCPGGGKLLSSQVMRVQFDDTGAKRAEEFCAWTQSAAAQRALRSIATGGSAHLVASQVRNIRFVPEPTMHKDATIPELVEAALRHMLAEVRQ